MNGWRPVSVPPDAETGGFFLFCRGTGEIEEGRPLTKAELQKGHASGVYGQVWAGRHGIYDDVTHYMPLLKPGQARWVDMPLQALVTVFAGLYPACDVQVRFGLWEPEEAPGAQVTIEGGQHVVYVNPYLPVLMLLEPLSEALAACVGGDDAAVHCERIRGAYDQHMAALSGGDVVSLGELSGFSVVLNNSEPTFE